MGKQSGNREPAPEGLQVTDFNKLRLKLSDAVRLENPLEQRLAVTAVITDALAPLGIRPVIVGGLAVQFYTWGGYATQDIDLVISDREIAKKVLEELGFERPFGERNWYYAGKGIVIEVPGEKLAGSPEKVLKIATGHGEIFLIGLEDIVLDRIEGYAATGSSGDRFWAESMLAVHYPEIDWPYLHKEAARRGFLPAVESVQKAARKHLPS